MFKSLTKFFKPAKIERSVILNQTTEGVSPVFKINIEHSDYGEISLLVEEINHPDSILVQVSNDKKSWFTVGTDIRDKGWKEYPILANWVRLYKIGSTGNAKVLIVG